MWFLNIISRKGVRVPILTGLVVMAVFALVYVNMDVAKHFELADDLKDKPWFAAAYISLGAFTNAMADATPKTTFGRTVFGFQFFLGWLFIATSTALLATR